MCFIFLLIVHINETNAAKASILWECPCSSPFGTRKIAAQASYSNPDNYIKHTWHFVVYYYLDFMLTFCSAKSIILLEQR